MGRPPSNGGPSFRFNQAEIAEMESILQAHKTAMPAREVLVALAEKFSNSEDRKGKIEVQMKQVWNWFQNRRYAIRAKAAKSPGKLNITQMTQDIVKGIPQATQPHVPSSMTMRSLLQIPQHPTAPSAAVRTFPQAPQHPAAFSVQSTGRVTDNSQMEYEAKSARDGAWYDVSTFLSHRSLETGDPEVLVRFAGFGAEEDEWVNVRKNVRQRSLPCESSECVAVLPADLILCFQEGKEQALYFDAHVLDAQRRRHDVRGCRCRFLVRYDHDQSEEIVALRKICRRPETDYRLQQLHAVNDSISAHQYNKNGANNIHTVSTLRVYPPAEVQPPKPMAQPSPAAEVPQKRQKVESTEGPQPQFKVEPMVIASQSGVQQNQPKEQSPVVIAPSPDQVQQKQHNVQPAQKGEQVVGASPAGDSVELENAEVPHELQNVQPAEKAPLPEVVPNHQHTVQDVKLVVEPQKVGVPSVEDSVESKNVEVPLELQNVQPAVKAPPPEVQQNQHNVQDVQKVGVPSVEDSVDTKDVEVHMQDVQPVMHDSSTEVSVEPHKVENVVPSVEEDSVELKNVKVPLEMQNVQPVMHDPSTEASVEPHNVENVVPSGEVLEKPQNVGPVVPSVAASGKAEAELHEVQPAVHDQSNTSVLEVVETKSEEPMVNVTTNNDVNVGDVEMESKLEEPVVNVSTNVVEAEVEEIP